MQYAKIYQHYVMLLRQKLVSSSAWRLIPGLIIKEGRAELSFSTCWPKGRCWRGSFKFQEGSSSIICALPLIGKVCHIYHASTIIWVCCLCGCPTCHASPSLKTWRPSLTSFPSLTTQLVLQAHCHVRCRFSPLLLKDESPHSWSSSHSIHLLT